MASPPTPPRRSAGTPAGRPGSPTAATCPACGAPLAADQRYCVECGARRGPLPAIVCEAIGAAMHARGAGRDEEGRERAGGELVGCEGVGGERTGGELVGCEGVGGERTGGEGVGREEAAAEALPLPTPRAAAVAVMALLAFGVLIGSSIAPVALSGANAPRLLALVRPVPAKAKAPPPVSETPTPPPATEEAAAPTPAPVTETVSQSTTKTKQPAAGKGKGEGEGASSPGAGTLPPIGHVFLIVLSDQGETAAFGPNSPAPYISKNLPAEGELLENYSAVAGGELANEIALISGQGPTPQTLENCPLYSDIAPGITGSEGQVLGSGCVYPRQTLTLANQLTDAGKTWKAYVGGIEAGGPGQPASCRHPTPGAADPDNAPSPGDAYVTWRNPFVYFHSIIDNTVCTQDDVGLPQLGSDLKDARSTPSLAYIVPDRCEDGSETPCAPGAPAGLAAAETFLRKVVPEIQASAAYREGGLIAITFDQAPQTGPGADSSGCCTLAPYPNLPPRARRRRAPRRRAPRRARLPRRPPRPRPCPRARPRSRRAPSAHLKRAPRGRAPRRRPLPPAADASGCCCSPSTSSPAP